MRTKKNEYEHGGGQVVDSDDAENDVFFGLTEVQSEVLRGYMENKSPIEIAQDIELSELTVGIVTNTLLRHFGMPSVAQMVWYCSDPKEARRNYIRMQ